LLISDENKKKADVILNEVVPKIHPQVKEELIKYV
jgi:hypothetical protein